MKRALVVLGLMAFAAHGIAGCAADSAEESAGGDEGSGEDDLTARQLPGVVAVEVAEVRARQEVLSSKTLGAPKKVKSVLTSVKKLKPTDPVPRCLERDTTRLSFFGAEGKALATVDTSCGGFGTISFADGREGYGVRFDMTKVNAAKDAPFAVGDAVWGITKIQLSKPGRPDKRTLTGEAMGPILAGLNLDEVPDPHASMPRCLPSHAVSFERAGGSVATTSFLCGATSASSAPASVKGHFTAPDPKGGDDADPLANGAVSIDPRPVMKAFETTQ